MGKLLDSYGNEIPSRSRRLSWHKLPRRTKALTLSLLGTIGAIALLLGNISTIRDSLFPNDPRLRVTFFESDSNILNLYPSVDTAVEHTEDIPLQLRIENAGGRAAKNVRLYLSHYLGVVLTTEYTTDEKRTWNRPNEAMKQLTLELSDINPGESHLVPILVRLDFPRDFQRAVRAPRENVVSKELLVPRAYPIYCDISSDACPSTRTALQIVLGNLEVLREQTEDVFWVGHGDDGVQVLKMKADFSSP